MLDGAQHRVRRPRARKNGQEVELPSLSRLRDRELLDQQMLSRIVDGVATRRYESVINGFADKTGISKSSVSRAFKRASKKHLDEINGADLSKYSFVSILIDGTGVGDSTQVIAVGITSEAEKIPLGLVSGDTENATVVKDLLTSITSRGFNFKSDRILAVLDGGKALRAAVKALWGDAVVIQRCWLHKLRNIKDYIPEVNHGQLWKRMKKMMGLNSHAQAQREYKLLLDWLSSINPDAAKSLSEAGDELLTVHGLGLTGEFRKSISSTNVIESLIGVVKTKLRNVKNWKDHPKTKINAVRDKELRWTAMAIQTHREKMRKLRRGKEQIEILINNLSIIDRIQKVG